MEAFSPPCVIPPETSAGVIPTSGKMLHPSWCSWYHSAMANEISQTTSKSALHKNDPDVPSSLSDSEGEELLSFFQLLDEWDRETASKGLVEEDL